MKVKLCGFTEINSVEMAVACKCDFIGFIFYEKSVRYISIEAAAKISASIPSTISKVAVVVDATIEFLEKISAEFSPDFFQFHGNESIDFLREVRRKFPGVKIIKAFGIAKEKDLEQIKNFENCADIFLLDNKVAGSGEKFNWEIIKDFHSKKDWFLSGGLNVNNIEEALKISGAKMIDISSGIEKTRGQKSPELIKELMKKIQNYVC
jgi:phosphoribosylanthranilate isomerase